ncbi:MAG: tetratricopeptide repeat protein [Acidobacteriota bacterium]
MGKKARRQPRASRGAGGMAPAARPRRRGLSLLAAAAIVAGALGAWIALGGRGGAPEPPPLHAGGTEPEVARKIEELRADVAARPGSAEAWGKLGMTFDAHSFQAEAVMCYRQAARIAPGEFRWAYLLALSSRDLGLPEASSWLSRCQEMRPRSAPVALLDGQMAFAAGHVPEAAAAFARALAIDPGLAQAHLGLARAAAASADLAVAREQLEKALALDPRFGEAHGLLAEVLRRQGDAAGAAREQDAAARLPAVTRVATPESDAVAAEGVSAFWYRKRGLALLDRGDAAKAEAELRRALAAAPDADAHHSLGTALQALGRSDDAIAEYRAALALDPTLSKTRNNLATVLQKAGRNDEAMEVLEEALRQDPAVAGTYFNLAVGHELRGDEARAIEALRAGLARAPPDHDLAPKHPHVLATSEDAALRDGPEAVRLAAGVASRETPQTARTLLVLALAHDAARERDDAIATARRALELAKAEHDRALLERIQAEIERLGAPG